MKKIFFLLSLLLAGCAARLPSIYEILKVDDGSPIFLSHNIRFTDPGNIPIENYLDGKEILPAGTEVALAGYDGEKVCFREIGTGRLFTIPYLEKRTMRPPEAYLPFLFSARNPLLGADPEKAALVREGKIARGMSKDEVRMSWGHPMFHRTPTLASDTWIYFRNAKMESVRIVFKNDKLSEILE